jgi:RNA recognition motif 2
MISGARLCAKIMHEVDDYSSAETLSVPLNSDTVSSSSTQPPTPIIKASDLEKTKSFVRGLFFDSSGRVRPRSVSAGESGKPKNIVPLAEAPVAELHSRRSSNTLFFDAVGKAQSEEHNEVVSGQRRASAPDVSFNEPTFNTYPYDYSHSHPHPHHHHHHPYPQPHPHAFIHDAAQMPYHHQHAAYPTYPYSYTPENPYMYANLSNWEYSTPVVSHVPLASPLPSSDYYTPPVTIEASVPSDFSPIARSPISPTTPSKSFGPRLQVQTSTLHARGPGAVPPPPPPERNLLNVQKIEDGLDTRTTVMIKNIPNKMSDKDLLAFISKVCPRRIDFLYLRMDFQNGVCQKLVT